MQVIICALCTKKQHVRKLYNQTFKKEDLSPSTYSARRMPDRVHYQINICENCGLVFSSPIFNKSQITRFYRESVCTYDEQVPYLVKTYLSLFEKIRNHLPKNPKVLEIGCGNGFFLKELMDRGIRNVYGVEPSEKMVKNANPYIRKRIIADMFRKNQFEKNTFDVVFCFHTLDHLVDPNPAISEMYRILNPGGFVLVVVHDVKGLSVKLFGEHSPIFDIEHIYLFNKNTLARIFAKNGFSKVEVFDLVNTYPLEYYLKMSGLPRIVKHIGLTFLKIIGVEQKTLSVKGGNIFLMAQK